MSVDDFSVTPDGHYRGTDGYIVPKDFAEFYTREPRYVRRWAAKWIHQSESSDVVRDLEQELLLYLHNLPETSKLRQPNERYTEGRSDVIQCFDPVRQYGASERRFRSYLKLCLQNKALTIRDRQNKNPIFRRDNQPYAGIQSEDNVMTVDDNYIHNHSEILERKAEHAAANVENFLLVRRFIEFVNKTQPSLCGTLDAISQTGTLIETQKLLGVGEATLNRDRKRLIELRDAFMNGTPVPKQRKHRKPYKKRIKATDSSTNGALLVVNFRSKA
jgi:hypothetical protein